MFCFIFLKIKSNPLYVQDYTRSESTTPIFRHKNIVQIKSNKKEDNEHVVTIF